MLKKLAKAKVYKNRFRNSMKRAVPIPTTKILVTIIGPKRERLSFVSLVGPCCSSSLVGDCINFSSLASVSFLVLFSFSSGSLSFVGLFCSPSLFSALLLLFASLSSNCFTFWLRLFFSLFLLLESFCFVFCFFFSTVITFK